jgi:predicted transposase YbfD/YdcC
MEQYGKVRPLYQVLAEVADPRAKQGQRHEFVAILMLVCAAMLCGYDNSNQIATWGQSLEPQFLKDLGFKRGRALAKSQLYAVLSQLDIALFERQLGTWVESVLHELDPVNSLPAVALDGKTLRGSKKLGATLSHLLSAVSHGTGLTLYQVGVDLKTNEIPLAQELLKGLLIEGRVFTMDALLTQRQLAQTLVEHKGDYFMLVKGNQPLLQQDIRFYFADPACPVVSGTTTLELGHGRIERRTLYATTALNDYLAWPAVGQAGLIERVRIAKSTGELLSHEQVCFVTSLTAQRASPAQLLQINRGHWTIENKSHYVRDVSFNEDASRVRKGNSAQVMAAFRNVTLAVLRRVGVTRIQEAFIKNSAKPFNSLCYLYL